jgi:uncharacterized membrane protein YhaH (DUF805 family)
MSAAQIHISIDGQKSGPYGKDDVRAWLLSGEIPTNALCWFAGMKTWQPVTTVFPDVRPPRPVFPGGGARYGPMEVGLGRLGYAGALALIFIVPLVAMPLFAGLIVTKSGEKFITLGDQIGPGLLIFLAVAVLTLAIWAAVKRVQNIGWSGWFVLLLLIPVLGSFFSLSLFVLPPHYARSRRLDGAEWFILTMVVLAIGATVMLVIHFRSAHHEASVPPARHTNAPILTSPCGQSVCPFMRSAE